MKRICKYKDCKTILSFYNSNKYCFIHLSKIRSEKEEKEELHRLQTTKKWQQLTKWKSTKAELKFAVDLFKKIPSLIKYKERINPKTKKIEFALIKKES